MGGGEVPFIDRTDAGNQLALALTAYQDQEQTIVLGLARGGVIVAARVAKTLHLPLEVICTRKIGAPFNAEYAVGAITESGQGVFDEGLLRAFDISKEYVQEAVAQEKQIAQQRLSRFRQGRPPRDLKGKVVILVDDGLATGATMKAAIQSAREEGARQLVVAIPVAPAGSLAQIKALVDDVICLESPLFFQAVGQFYREFPQVEDEEVVFCLYQD